MPTATDTESEAWPAMNASWTLSDGLGKPASPPKVRRVFIASLRPVSILWI